MRKRREMKCDALAKCTAGIQVPVVSLKELEKDRTRFWRAFSGCFQGLADIVVIVVAVIAVAVVAVAVVTVGQ